MTTTTMAEAAPRLGDLVAFVRTSGQRVTILDDGTPVATLVRPAELQSCDDTIGLLSNPEWMRRIFDGEAAIQGGDLLTGSDLDRVDPEQRWLRAPNQRGAAARGDRWDLQLSGPASRALTKLAPYLVEMVLRYVSEVLMSDPVRGGVELRGMLNRRFVAHVETELVVYRLDSVKQSLRVIEVLHGPGMIGQVAPPGKSW